MRTVWLASYPKSGNTWMRMLIGALSLPDGGPAEINALADSGGIASNRAAFDAVTLLESGLMTFEEIDCLRPAVYEAQATGLYEVSELEPADAKVRFVKTHDAYTYLPSGQPLLAGRRGADGVVLIVRDPRDVAPSMANHNGTDIDTAVMSMADPRYALCSTPKKQHQQLRQQLPGWSGFNQSWLGQTDLPVLLVRYEEMKADAAIVLARVMAFAGDPCSPEKAVRAADRVDFRDLVAQEAEKGFREASRKSRTGRFFRRGEAGAWREELTGEQVRQIEAAHGPMMRRLGYTLAGDDQKMAVAGALG